MRPLTKPTFEVARFLIKSLGASKSYKLKAQSLCFEAYLV